QQTSEEATLMLTGDFNAASVEWTVQWKISEPKDYLFSFYRQDNPLYTENVIRTATRTVMNQLVGDYSLDEVLTAKKEAIAVKAREATQNLLNALNRGDNLKGCGIMITDLQMQRVTPPNTVKPAYDAVLAAIQKSEQLKNEANKERNMLRPAAEAMADKNIQEAEGYAARRRAEVNGEIKALMGKYEAYKNFPEVTRQRLYLESMQTVLSAVESKTVIDSDLKQLLPLLQLNSGGNK
ncbi:MAG: FtsH protease activity modulator HflK, partial [Planctomycetaceae bacterium]